LEIIQIPPLEAINIAGQWKACGFFFFLKLTLFQDHCILCKVFFFWPKKGENLELLLLFGFFFFLVG
jgi:hypothetical protein